MVISCKCFYRHSQTYTNKERSINERMRMQSRTAAQTHEQRNNQMRREMSLRSVSVRQAAGVNRRLSTTFKSPAPPVIHFWSLIQITQLAMSSQPARGGRYEDTVAGFRQLQRQQQQDAAAAPDHNYDKCSSQPPMPNYQRRSRSQQRLMPMQSSSSQQVVTVSGSSQADDLLSASQSGVSPQPQDQPDYGRLRDLTAFLPFNLQSRTRISSGAMSTVSAATGTSAMTAASSSFSLTQSQEKDIVTITKIVSLNSEKLDSVDAKRTQWDKDLVDRIAVRDAENMEQVENLSQSLVTRITSKFEEMKQHTKSEDKVLSDKMQELAHEIVSELNQVKQKLTDQQEDNQNLRIGQEKMLSEIRDYVTAAIAAYDRSHIVRHEIGVQKEEHVPVTCEIDTQTSQSLLQRSVRDQSVGTEGKRLCDSGVGSDMDCDDDSSGSNLPDQERDTDSKQDDDDTSSETTEIADEAYLDSDSGDEVQVVFESGVPFRADEEIDDESEEEEEKERIELSERHYYDSSDEEYFSQRFANYEPDLSWIDSPVPAVRSPIPSDEDQDEEWF